MKKALFILSAPVALMLIISFSKPPQSLVTGAWHYKEGNTEAVLIYQDGYFTHTMYNQVTKKFIMTTGGTYKEKKGKLVCQVEFDTHESINIGKEHQLGFTVAGNKLTISGDDGVGRELTRLDDGSGALAGNWRITARMQNDKMNKMQKADRKTLKILSGTRFQWMAINPATKEFFGTGGGSYTFVNGKYTENIEFFSRDSSRVGASLSFEGSVANDIWTHKGMNSKGEPLQEEWSREK